MRADETEVKHTKVELSFRMCCQTSKSSIPDKNNLVDVCLNPLILGIMFRHEWGREGSLDDESPKCG